MREKRKFIRFYTSLKVSYILQEEPKIEKMGITKDISAGGIQLLTEEKLNVGDKLEMKLYLPKASNPAHLGGIVLWTKEILGGEKPSYSSGIEFKGIEEDNKNTFLKFMCDIMYRKTGKD